MTGGSRSPSMIAADGGETLLQTDRRTDGGAELHTERRGGHAEKRVPLIDDGTTTGNKHRLADVTLVMLT